jgi:protein O-GlcNAc transferase
MLLQICGSRTPPRSQRRLVHRRQVTQKSQSGPNLESHQRVGGTAILSEASDDHLLHSAVTLSRNHQLEAAVHVLAELVGRRPEHCSALLPLSQLQLQLGAREAAVQAASIVVQRQPDNSAAHYALGRAHKALGDTAKAVACYQRAIEANPANADALTSLAIIRRSAGDLDAAIDLYHRALVIDPNHAAARINLGNALGAGQTGTPSTLEQQRSAAIALVHKGLLPEALAEFESLLAVAPQDARLWHMAGTVAQELGRSPSLLLPFFETAAQLDPRNKAAAATAHMIRFVGGISDNAPTETMPWQGLFVPAIHESVDAIHATRRRYEASLDAHIASGGIGTQRGVELQTGSFFLAYHGENDRDLQVKAAQLHLKVMPELLMSAPHCARQQLRPGRIRVGFISRHLAVHSIGRTTGGLVRSLDRDRFESYAIRITPSVDDWMTRQICEAADHEVVLDARLANAREQIAALELDVLFFQDIGLDRTSYLLAFARLAPVQCVSFGHPDTTGIPNVDYFISNDLYETPEAESHYSERLFLLRDLPTLAYYYNPRPASTGVDRTAIGLPAHGTLYVCPQALFKFHPDFDTILHGILTRDPEGILVLIRGNFEQWTSSLQQRFERALPDVCQRIVFLPPLQWTVFLDLLAMSDVALDTLHFNGMNSSLECLAMGTPVVTLPTQFQRGRHTQAMYRKMGISDCIAADPTDYVDIAVRLGTDSQFAAQMRERILAQNHVLFENLAVVREFERFFTEATALAWGGVRRFSVDC